MRHSKPLFRFHALTLAVAAGSAQWVCAQELHNDDAVEEIIVTSSLQQSRAETALPVNVLSGEALREKASSTLGDTLKELVGVNSASFGSGVGLPVIRGQSGSRVQVLQGGVSNMDASAISPDHANSVEAALAERIEVVRGPATLLYGNGAIGGVVNVIDNRIPSEQIQALTGLVETRHNSVSDQQTSVLKLEGGSGSFAFHLDGTYRESNDTTIPGFAVNPATVDMDDEEAMEQFLDSKGKIGNSSTRAHANTLGLSWVTQEGYLGIAAEHLESNYGLPAAAHPHHEEEGFEHAAEEEGAHEEEAGIRIAMHQDRYDFEGERSLNGFFSQIQGKFSVVDYEHAEIEGDGALGTVYANKGREGRFTLTHSPIGGLQGVTGLQIGRKSFSAIGEEAYIARTDSESLGLFSVQNLDVGNTTYEFGLRAERQELNQAGSACDDSTSSLSGSASALWRLRDDTNLMVALAHSQRAAGVEERFSNIDNSTCREFAGQDLIAHAATQRLEIGDPAADKERSTNIEIGLRRHMGSLTGDLNLFYNDIKDYLYMRDTGVYVDEVQIARMSQEDAVFRGVEVEMSMPVSRNDRQMTQLSLFGDYVRATLDSNGNVPRIPALRVGAEVSHAHSNWQYKLRATRVSAQKKTALNETSSGAYTLLNASVDYHVSSGEQALTIFGKATNLLDEKIRNHTSVLKDVAPEAGRALVLGMRFEF